MKSLVEPAHPRLSMASRVLAAVFGGYAFAAACAVFLSYAIPLQVAQAVVAASLPSFALYVAAVIWVFSAGTATRAWLGLLLPTLLLGAASMLMRNAAGGV